MMAKKNLGGDVINPTIVKDLRSYMLCSQLKFSMIVLVHYVSHNLI